MGVSSTSRIANIPVKMFSSRVFAPALTTKSVEDREPLSQLMDARHPGNAIALVAMTMRSMIGNKDKCKVLRQLALRAIPLSVGPGDDRAK
jgi:hypothetical protein